MSGYGKKIKISICMGSSCYPRGNDKNLELVKHYLKVHCLEERVELSGHRCQDNCHLGPNLIVNETPHQEVHPAVLPSFLKQMIPVFSTEAEVPQADDERGAAAEISIERGPADDD